MALFKIKKAVCQMKIPSISTTMSSTAPQRFLSQSSKMCPSDRRMVHCPSQQTGCNQGWGCSKLRSPWNANLGRALRVCFWAAALSPFPSYAAAGVPWSEERVCRNPIFRGRDGPRFWLFSSLFTASVGKKKCKLTCKWALLCSQDSQFTFVSPAQFNRKHPDARSH